MEKIIDISVIVTTYNPVWSKLKATLTSLIEQEDVSLQIVITDDGSKVTLFDKVELFFKKSGFLNYKLIANIKNEGTVCNYYHGVAASDAEYIKCISPGDLLFDKKILSKWLSFVRNNNADITFADAVFYNFGNGIVNIIKQKHNPRNTKIYLRPSTYYDKVINYIIIGDTISGATIMVRKDVLLYYLKLLLHRVIYAGDFFIRLAVLDKRRIIYYPYPGIWYEFGDGGISTTGESVWGRRLRKDDIEMDNICKEHWNKEDKKVAAWLRDYYEYRRKEHISFCEKLKRPLNPMRWYWRTYMSLFCAYTPVNVDDAFLKHCFET